MSEKSTSQISKRAAKHVSQRATDKRRARRMYERACGLAERGENSEARGVYERLVEARSAVGLKALVENDLAALAAVGGDRETARRGFKAALQIDPQCQPARLNLALLEADAAVEEEESKVGVGPPTPALPHNGGGNDAPTPALPHEGGGSVLAVCEPDACKMAILSFLFNWPSTGGGIVHTVELAKFLAKAGYAVRHFYARYLPWGIGRVEQPVPIESEALEFDEATWNVPGIQARFREAVDGFGPDYVIIMDSWNMKPHLAHAVRGYPYYLRFQAQECLCPLNNLRLLLETEGRFRQCPLNQLATPEECKRCVGLRGRFSGSLHQAERALAGVGTPEYDQTLRRALMEAEALLVLNPLVEQMLAPYAKCVRVVPWGMDSVRFPWPWPDSPHPNPPPQGGRESSPERKATRLLFAGLVEEPIKGFVVLEEACRRLWQKRQDFELMVTSDPPGRANEFTHYVGWASQEELPRYYHEADIVVVPTIAQDGLSRTSVEAMAAGKPVVASRIGGLPYTVMDGATGLLSEPGDAQDLANKIEILLDDAELRAQMGRAGRRRFEEHFTWDVVIERYYRPLLKAQQTALV